MYVGSSIDYIKSFHRIDRSNLKQIPKHSIPREISPINIQIIPLTDKPTKFGVIKAAPNHPADKLEKRAENATDKAFLSLLFICINVTGYMLHVT